MRIAIGLLLILHGAIHSIGLVKAFKPSALSDFTFRLSKAQGVLWAIAMLLFISAGSLYLAKWTNWWIVVLPAVFLSQVLIAQAWGAAKWGTVANLIALVLLLISVFGSMQRVR